MGYTKDLWTRPESGPDGKTIRVRNERWGKGKRWLAGWIDPDGAERSKVFRTRVEADRHWAAMETQMISLSFLANRQRSANAGWDQTTCRPRAL